MVFIAGAVGGLGWPALSAWWVSRRDMNRLLLFVCGGNTCRSPMAAAIARQMISENNLNYTVASAGVAVHTPGDPLTEGAAAALRALGVTVPATHRSVPVSAELVGDTRAVYCMTAEQRDAVIRIAPHVADRTYTLDPDGDIEDPLGKSMQTYRFVAERIQAAVRQRLAPRSDLAASPGS